ncbi:hypothetical protein Scep_027615 [Stephania cephalantha]|uniref:Uncharacterized protein n=1 Tax=Stephania cephalantha TaxID=152367 RepID=A0AAP0EBJ1_9MAGN
MLNDIRNLGKSLEGSGTSFEVSEIGVARKLAWFVSKLIEIFIYIFFLFCHHLQSFGQSCLLYSIYHDLFLLSFHEFAVMV